MPQLSLFLSLFCFLAPWGLMAQTSFLYTNLKIQVGDGQVIDNGVLGVRQGRISLVGPANSPYNPQDYDTLINGQGQWAYPAFIAPNTQLGLVEIESVRATRDFSEVGVFNPNIRSLIAFNSDSEILPTVVSNGVLIAEAVPQGGRISGRSSLLYLQARNWEEATCQADNALHLWWPQRFHATGWWAEPGNPKGNKNYSLEVQGIDAYLQAAQAYAQQTQVNKINLKFEAMKPLFQGQLKLFVHVDEAQAMLEAIELLKTNYQIPIVLVGATEAWQIADQIAQNQIPLILGDLHSLPVHPDSDYDQPYRTPAILAEKNILFCFSMSGAWQQRNLAFQAGQALAYGLSYEQALAGLSLNTAKILGIDDRLGTLSLGKEASFFLSKGDALDMSTQVITAAYLRGQALDLQDKQKKLNTKYRQILGLDN